MLKLCPQGSVVTRMTILPVNGVISEITIETSESGISVPEEIGFDLNAKNQHPENNHCWWSGYGLPIIPE